LRVRRNVTGSSGAVVGILCDWVGGRVTHCN
jgi:hypothetical protein